MSEDNLTQLEKQSIQAALTQDWNKASTLNQKILKIDDKNIEALNRLAKAKIELRIFDEAKAILEKVLNLDKFNSIAKANLERAQRTQTKKTKADFSTSISKIQIVSFIEEPGKTKTVTLVNLGERQSTDCLQSGEEIKFHPLKRKIKVLSLEGNYLGSLPEDISLTLSHHINLGSKFQGFIKGCNTKQINVFIKEVSKSPKLKGVAPFSSDNDKYNNSTIIKHHAPMNSPLEIYDPETESEN
jgi:hypothetical protein